MTYDPDSLLTVDLATMLDEEFNALYAAAMDALNENRQLFIIHMGNGETITQAYKKSGYECKNDASAQTSGSRLLSKAMISNALKLHREMQRRMAGLTVESAMARFARLSAKAEEAEDYNAARSCFAEAVKLADLYPAAKSETTINDNRSDFVQSLTTDQLAQVFAKAREQSEREETKH